MRIYSALAIRIGAAVPLACFVRVASAQIQPVTLRVNFSLSSAKRISPLVYGANFATPDEAASLNLPINRNGGNATTRYNWQQDSTSSGSDWYFLSHPAGGNGPSGSVDEWIRGNLQDGVPGGTQSMVTVPILGYVANVGPTGYSWSFSVSKYGPQQLTEPWHPDAGNGVWTNGQQVTGNDPNDANMPVSVDYQAGWIQHLVSAFGNAQSGGVGYYLLDNEPGLWMQTHRDVFPNGVTMADLFGKERDAATLVKSVDPGAKICGPESWGWLGYLYSGSDYQWLANHGWQGTPPDKAAHGGLDCVAYLLQQFNSASRSAGNRLLDVFSLHYYPQGNYGSGDSSEAATEWRNRSTRSLWDPSYTDESWIDAKIDLIPRMKEWVSNNYPGTALGITEYNWGDDDNVGAAIAQADALGIFGREGVNLATRWVCPQPGTQTFKVFQMYRNYDGADSAFGEIPLELSVPDPDTLSAYMSGERATGEIKLMVIHKRTSGDAPVTLDLSGASFIKKLDEFQLTSNGLITHTFLGYPGSTASAILPPQSVTLFVIGHARHRPQDPKMGRHS